MYIQKQKYVLLYLVLIAKYLSASLSNSGIWSRSHSVQHSHSCFRRCNAAIYSIKAINYSMNLPVYTCMYIF